MGRAKRPERTDRTWRLVETRLTGAFEEEAMSPSRGGLVAAASVLARAHLAIAGLTALAIGRDQPAPNR